MKNLFKLFLLLFSGIIFANELEKVSLQLQWKHQFEFAGFYMAKEKGFYKDALLDVDFTEYDGKSNIVENILNKNYTFGLTYSSLIADYLNGKDIVFVANYFKQSPLVLVTQKNIKTPKDLKYKKVMGVSDQIDSVTLRLMLEKFDVSTNDIINVPTTFNINDFVNKKVDAMTAFTTNEVFQLDQLAYQYNIFNPSIYGYEYYDVNLFTSKEVFSKRPKMVKAFKDASNKGWEYALKHKEETVNLILKKYNTQNKSKEALLFEANQIEHIMLSSSDKIGEINLQRVEFIAKNLIESGYVNNKEKKTYQT